MTQVQAFTESVARGSNENLPCAPAWSQRHHFVGTAPVGQQHVRLLRPGCRVLGLLRRGQTLTLVAEERAVESRTEDRALMPPDERRRPYVGNLALQAVAHSLLPYTGAGLAAVSQDRAGRDASTLVRGTLTKIL